MQLKDLFKKTNYITIGSDEESEGKKITSAQAQAQAQYSQASSISPSAAEVISRINAIEANGASRETMREVATLLQKERAKPENKTPEAQKRLNEALGKLLKAMSGATKS